MTRALDRVRRRLRGEDGFTLPELLVGCVIGTTVLLVAFGLIIAGQRASALTQSRVETQQRVRTVMEQVVQELRSQTCLGVNQPAITQGDATSITFYSDLGNETFRPDKRRLVFSGGTLTEEVYAGTGTPPNMTFPATPTRTRVLLQGVAPLGTTPFLRYFSFAAAAPITPDVPLPVPLSTGTLGDVRRAVRIGIAFNVTSSGSSAAPVPAEAYVYARTADPLDPTHSPLCL